MLEGDLHTLPGDSYVIPVWVISYKQNKKTSHSRKVSWYLPELSVIGDFRNRTISFSGAFKVYDTAIGI